RRGRVRPPGTPRRLPLRPEARAATSTLGWWSCDRRRYAGSPADGARGARARRAGGSAPSRGPLPEHVPERRKRTPATARPGPSSLSYRRAPRVLPVAYEASSPSDPTALSGFGSLALLSAPGLMHRVEMGRLSGLPAIRGGRTPPARAARPPAQFLK